MKITRHKHYLIPVLLFSMMSSVLWAQETGETVIMRGIVDDDLYVAGKLVDIQADVRGDVVAAGQNVTINKLVEGDVIAAGETVDIRATVNDDVRLAGRQVIITGMVGDHVVAAGETVRIHSGVTIGGWAWLAGQSVDVAGNIGRELKVAGEHVTVSGKVAGDAIMLAENIEILPGAHIQGQLIYHGPNKPQVHANAQIDGGIIERPMPPFVKPEVERRGGGLIFGISLMITCLVYFLVFPHFSILAARTIGSEPGKSIALGLASLVTIPFVTFLLLISVIGHQLALVLLATYMVCLLAGLLTGIFYVADTGLRMIGKGDAVTHWVRSISIIVTIVVLGIVLMIPLVGVLIVFLLLLFGLGALNLNVWRVYKAAK